MKFVRSTLTLLAAIMVFAQASLAADLHVVMAIDTNDFSIGTSVENDMYHYQEFVQKIADYTDMNVNEMIFSGDAFISDDVYNYVKDLKINPDDMVIFYYSGHGYRTEAKTTVWPVMHFGFQQLGLDVQDVADLVVAKAPRMALIMSDTCNGVEDERFAPEWERNLMASRVSDAKIREGYRQLFLGDDLLIMTTSSEPGQYSWGPESGGIYTSAFLKSMYYEVKRKDPDWTRLLERAQKKVDKMEHPLFEITPMADVLVN